MINKIRQSIVRPPYAPSCDLQGRKFIITGAAENSLGFATAKTMLEWGAEVVITRRTKSQGVADLLKRQLPEENHSRIFSHDLDLSQAESVKNFVNWYRQERKKLDVLINNAGIHLDLLSQWKDPKQSDDGFEIQWRTNYLGTVHLSHLLLPLLLESASATNDARIVNVVSMLHSKGSNSEFFDPLKPYNSWEAYGQSKLGLIHFTNEIQRRFSQQGLQAYCLHPGAVYTNVAGVGLAGNPLIETIRKLMAPIEKFFLMTPTEGAQTQILCATAPGLKGGEYYRNCKQSQASSDAQYKATSEKLWHETVGWLDQIECK